MDQRAAGKVRRELVDAGLDTGSLLTNGVFGPECTLGTAAQMRWEYLDDDVNKSIDVTRRPGGVQTLHEVTGGNPWSSAIYRDYMDDHDLAQEMLVALRAADGHVWGTVRLNRPRAMVPFDESDRQFMRSVASCLAEGMRRGLLAGATSAAPAPSSPGLVMVDRLGRPVAISATARQWLALFPDSPASDGGLPLPIHAVSFAALAGAGLFGLTPRELQVAELVVGGHATRRMAHMLGILPYTAQEHLRHIFGKVGVASRGELVAALFLE